MQINPAEISDLLKKKRVVQLFRLLTVSCVFMACLM